MADGTCYAIPTAGVWEVSDSSPGDICSIEKGTGSSPAEGKPRLSLSFTNESKAQRLLIRFDFVIKRPCRYFAHPSNFIRLATAY